jgi:hypothetical protein
MPFSLEVVWGVPLEYKRFALLVVATLMAE